MLRRLSPLIPLLPLAIAAYFVLRADVPSVEHVRFALYRPANAQFYIDRSTPAGTSLEFAHGAEAIAFGRPGDIGLACPQDHREESYGLRVYADGLWYLSSPASRPASGDVALGAPGDVPLCADFDGDGRADSGVFRAGEWIVHTSGPLRRAEIRFRFGDDGDLPVILKVRGRGNGTDRRDVVYGVYRNGYWNVDLDGDGKVDAIHAFGGMPQDRPLLIPRWGGSGQRPYSLAIFRDGMWYVKPDPDGASMIGFGYGQTGDVPSVLY